MRKYGAYIPALLMDACISSILTNAAFFVTYLYFSSTFLGTLTAICTGVFVLLAIPFGRLSDRVGRPRVLTISCLSLAAVSILLPLCTRKLHLMMVFPCSGIGMALFWPTYEAWLAEREGAGDLIRRITIFNLFWTVGITVGPMIASYLYQGTSPIVPFYLAGAFSIINWICLKSQTIGSRTRQHPLGPRTIIEAPPHYAHHIFLRIARISNFASWFSLGIVRHLAPKLTVEAGIPARAYGNLILVLGAAQLIGFVALGTDRAARWHYRLYPLIGVQSLAVIAFLMIGFLPHGPAWAFAFAAIGLSGAFTYFSSMYYSLHAQQDKGNKSGWHEAVLGSGLLLGPLVGGVSADSRLGASSPYVLCALVIGLCSVLEAGIWFNQKQIEES
ncbi:MAG: MFS transporter [Candidatus Poribacteria bacterium]|nr:MFS transporter [Candidatus Poribacteria bacterium]MDE0506881.1 MFS transporter [Candidatus Poribacteria bacterium]